MTSYQLPSEWQPQRAVWCSWPGNPVTWSDRRDLALTAYATLVATLTRFLPVDLICPASWRNSAETFLTRSGTRLDRITWHDWPLNDAWCRDHAPLFVHNAGGGLELVDLPYNAWGGKFSPWDADDAIPSRVSDTRNLPRHRFPYIGEGGALEINDAGVLLTTESVWLNPNRNPGLTREEAEKAFENYLGVTETFWLSGGLPGDDTDGHIDTLARFVDDHTVALPVPDSSHPDAEILLRNRDRVSERFEVAALPHPFPLPEERQAGAWLPRTYANYLLINGAVLVPTYAQPETDQQACVRLGELYPGREVVPVPCEALMQEGGAVHCLTMQEPLPQGSTTPDRENP